MDGEAHYCRGLCGNNFTILSFYFLFMLFLFLYFFCNCLSFDFLGIQFFPYGKIVEIFVGCHICLMKSLAKVLLLLDFFIFLEGLIFNKQMFQIEICTGNLSNFLNQMF